jgi:hypothetical protein
MANSQGLEQVKFHTRPGEGAIIEINRKMTPKPDGTFEFQIALDLGSAPVPDRRYVADAAHVTYSNSVVSLIFWQKKITSSEARSMVVVTIASAAVLQHLQNAEAQMNSLMKSVYANEGTLEALPMEPLQTVCLAANIIASGWSGREACIDFYYASPFVLGMLPKNGKFSAEPIVRVTLSTGILNAVWHKMASYKSLFPKDELEAMSARVGEDNE